MMEEIYDDLDGEVSASEVIASLQKRIEALEVEKEDFRQGFIREGCRAAYITDLRELLKQERKYVDELRSRIEELEEGVAEWHLKAYREGKRIEALEGQVERVRGCQRYRVDYHPMAGGTETTDNPDGPYMKADDVLKALNMEKDDD